MKKRLGLGLIIVGVLIALPASSILLSLIAAAFSEYGWSRGIPWYWVIVYVLPTPVSLAMIYFGWRLSKQRVDTTLAQEETTIQAPSAATKTLAVMGIFFGASISLSSFSTFILIGIDPMYAVWSAVSLIAGAGIIWLSLRSLKVGRK
jgi:hypothetical protein